MCRLYQLEVRWLVRLWRLFRGRRWNPEKQRVETWPYTLEQLFLGTLCFTILLFLFPTVLLYYTVFVVVSSETKPCSASWLGGVATYI